MALITHNQEFTVIRDGLSTVSADVDSDVLRLRRDEIALAINKFISDRDLNS